VAGILTHLASHSIRRQADARIGTEQSVRTRTRNRTARHRMVEFRIKTAGAFSYPPFKTAIFSRAKIYRPTA